MGRQPFCRQQRFAGAVAQRDVVEVHRRRRERDRDRAPNNRILPGKRANLRGDRASGGPSAGTKNGAATMAQKPRAVTVAPVNPNRFRMGEVKTVSGAWRQPDYTGLRMPGKRVQRLFDGFKAGLDSVFRAGAKLIEPG